MEGEFLPICLPVLGFMVIGRLVMTIWSYGLLVIRTVGHKDKRSLIEITVITII